MTGRLRRLALAAAMLAAGAGGAGAEYAVVVIQGLPQGEEALVDIISIDDPSQRQAAVIRNSVEQSPADLLRWGRQYPVHSADLPPGAYTVYVRDMETGEHWPSQTIFIQRGKNGFVVMRRRRAAGGGEGGDGQGGQGGNN